MVELIQKSNHCKTLIKLPALIILVFLGLIIFYCYVPCNPTINGCTSFKEDKFYNGKQSKNSDTPGSLGTWVPGKRHTEPVSLILPSCTHPCNEEGKSFIIWPAKAFE